MVLIESGLTFPILKSLVPFPAYFTGHLPIRFREETSPAFTTLPGPPFPIERKGRSFFFTFGVRFEYFHGFEGEWFFGQFPAPMAKRMVARGPALIPVDGETQDETIYPLHGLSPSD